MYITTAASLTSLCAVAAAVPFSFPLANGFPDASAAAVDIMEQNAGGTLPNTALPTSLSAVTIRDLKVVAVNEIFEVAYFTSLLKNVTGNVAGYTGMPNKQYIETSLMRIRAQEELHATGANAILKSAGAATIGPCKYQFPVTDYDSAIALAATFTDLVLGALQGVQQDAAISGGQGASDVVPLIGSIIGQEGEQDGFYRYSQNKAPSASPFLTSAAGQFAFNAINQMFIVPGSCGPEVAAIDIPAYKTLTPLTKPGAANTTVTYQTTQTGITSAADYVTYISGQNIPVTVPITDIATKGGLTTFKASFPFANGFSKGLTIAALTKGKGPFASAAFVAASTLAGPGLIEVE